MSRYFNQMDIDSGNYLEHYGVLGMKWGVRRYVNSDGTLTAEGRAKYGKTGPGSMPKRYQRYQERHYNWDINNGKGKHTAYHQLKSEYEEGIRKKIYGKAEKAYKSYEKSGNYDESKENRINAMFDQAYKSNQKVLRSYIDKFASVRLREMGYQDTAAGRDFLKTKSSDYTKLLMMMPYEDIRAQKLKGR